MRPDMAGACDPNDPTWAYVSKALDLGRWHARRNGYVFKGECCFVVAAIALGAVIHTRRGHAITSGPRKGTYLIDTDNPNDIALAYADHYLHMRGEAARLGPHGRAKLELQTRAYDDIKGGIARMRDIPEDQGWVDLPGTRTAVRAAPVRALGKALDWLLRESDKPLSKPTEESFYWGLQGINDGMRDHAANPGIDNEPAWFRALQTAT
jgi:hypothetical protein